MADCDSAKTIPDAQVQIEQVGDEQAEVSRARYVSDLANYEDVRALIESMPAPRRPNRNRPLDRTIPGTPPIDRLLKLSEVSPPPQRWFDGEEEDLFGQ